MQTFCEGVLLRKTTQNLIQTIPVTYDNLQGVAHVLEESQYILSLVWANIALNINFDTKNKTSYLYTLNFTLLSNVKFNM